MYAVIGSTGQVGGAVVRALRAQGKEVRALLRDDAKTSQVESLGAEPLVASVEDGSRLQMAFEEAEGVFVMTPPLYKAPDPRGENQLALASLAHALQAAHVPKAVLLSSIGAQHAAGTGAILKSFDMEQALLPLHFNKAVIRAAYFMENLLPMLPHVRETGKLPVTWGTSDSEIPMVGTEDIGRFVAKLLTENWEGTRIVEFEGPQPYTFLDVARILSEKLGRTVTPEAVPAEAQQGMYEAFGLTPGAASGLVEMASGFGSGLVAFEGGGRVEHAQGTTTLEAFLAGL